jgi:hypothetical protein
MHDFTALNISCGWAVCRMTGEREQSVFDTIAHFRRAIRVASVWTGEKGRHMIHHIISYGVIYLAFTSHKGCRISAPNFQKGLELGLETKPERVFLPL